MTESGKSCIKCPFTIRFESLSFLDRIRLCFGNGLQFRHEIYFECAESKLPKIAGFNVSFVDIYGDEKSLEEPQ